MLNFVYMTDRDRKEAAAIERRRALEEERKKRIFNPKARISLDYRALDEQIAQKKKQQEEEKQVDLQYEQLQAQFAAIATEMSLKEKEERKKLAQEINNFRLNFQRLQDRREYDLNDPKSYKSIPARLYDNDPRCGPSSAQKFEGEDLYSKERMTIQKEQLKVWLDQQMDEKDAAEKERIDAENAYKAALMARDQRAVELANLENECRKRLNLACSDYNKALANEREIECTRKREMDEKDSQAHKYNIMMSDMMTENLDSTSALGPNRKNVTSFKGMSQQAKEAFVHDLKLQIEEAKQKKEEQKRYNREWDDYSNGVQSTIAAMDQEIRRKQRDLNKVYADENKALEIEQKNHQEFLKKVVYSNRPTAAFYDQFNKSTR